MAVGLSNSDTIRYLSAFDKISLKINVVIMWQYVFQDDDMFLIISVLVFLLFSCSQVKLNLVCSQGLLYCSKHVSLCPL